ncbi:MAG TPA: trypsin-like peptidase domain-containing protein [Micromonosporaceae bacterium]|nr:trypsin-like peptidase domain-containing protein [Micromonosporaceae bacterium]
MRAQNVRRLLSGTALVAVVAGLTACTQSVPGVGSATSAPSTPGADSLQSAYVQTIRTVLPSVVLIRTSRDLGSGVVFDNKGNIVTNAHVAGSATTFQVTPSGTAKTLQATLVGTFPPDDLAVIHVNDAAGLKPATFADSSKVAVGDIVLAMGNPLGLTSSVTNGIVSAVGRTVSEPASEGSPGATLPDTIQTSAAINPGNSGGALVNLADQVIGIPTLAATDQQNGGAAPGIGFAISSNIVKDIAGQLVANGKVTNSHRAALGIRATTVAGPNGQPAGAGVVDVTPGGPAEKAGIEEGDVIVELDGTAVRDTDDLSAILANLSPGQKTTAKVQRADGSTGNVSITLGTLPS